MTEVRDGRIADARGARVAGAAEGGGPSLPRVRRFLSDAGAGWLRNTVAEPSVTCATCRLPTGGAPRCSFCARQAVGPEGAGLADRVAPVAYAVQGQESGRVMHGYKAKGHRPRVPEHAIYVAHLAAVALLDHGACVGRLAGLPVTTWSVVPSMPPTARPGEHPLRAIVAPVAPGSEVPLLASEQGWDPRSVRAGNYRPADERTLAGAHALVIDDTWVTGGHAQSAALALRIAGARTVSVLTLTRWIWPDDLIGSTFVQALPGTFDPGICPWTAARCPC